MHTPKQHTPKAIQRQVVGWVLVLPLLVAFLKMAFPFGLFLGLATIAASIYGVVFAKRHASRGMTLFALIVTLLNVISWLMLSTASVLMALYFIVRFYAYV
jgi:hypothetical protein